MSSLNDEDRANLAAYLDGELDEESTQALEAKIAVDPDARQEVEELRQAWTLLDYLPRAETSDNFTNRTMERLAVGRAVSTATMPTYQPWKWSSVAGWAAAVLIALAGGATLSYFLVQPKETHEHDELLVRHLRVIEKLDFYQKVDNIEFLEALDDPQLFGSESGS